MRYRQRPVNKHVSANHATALANDALAA